MRYLSIVLLAGLAACGRDPGAFPPPAQRVSAGARDPGELSDSVRMDEATVDEYLVRDISPEKTAWRWTFLKPELKLIPKSDRNLKLWMELAIPPVTFRVTGPVTLTCYLDGKPLGTMRLSQAGRHRFEKPVPEGWVRAGAAVAVSAEVDKRFTAKEDGAQLGFLLNAVGLTP